MISIVRFLLSFRTVFGLLLASMAIAVVGSLVLPYNLAFFSGIDDTALFKWLAREDNLKLTWWIYALIAAMAALGASTVACTVEALMKIRGRKNLALKLSPQVMHLGVLFVMLGHLLTASLGTKADVRLETDHKAQVTDEVSIGLKEVRSKTDEAGYETDWEARIVLFYGGSSIGEEEFLRPARPIYAGQTGFYLKSIKNGDAPSALVRVCRDPGALWALIGGSLVAAGGLGFIYGRFKA